MCTHHSSDWKIIGCQPQVVLELTLQKKFIIYNHRPSWTTVAQTINHNFTSHIDKVVQSLNSPLFPPHIGAEPGRAKRESRITCMRMPKTNQSKITRPMSIRVHTCSR